MPAPEPDLPAWAIVAADAVRTGGMDIANHALIRYLADRGRQVHVVSHRLEPDLAGSPNVRFHRVLRPLGSTLLGVPLIDLVGRRIARQVARGGGHVLVNGGNCRWHDANWVHYVHAVWRPQVVAAAHRRWRFGLAHRKALHDERAVIPRARVIIADSERTRRDAIDALGCPPDRVHTVYYGIDPERFRPATADERAEARRALGWQGDRRFVVFIGALGDRRKGFDSLFEAWLALCARPEWTADLVVVGTGVELAAWKQRAAASGQGARFHFLGFRKDVPRILAAADALVSPTRYEAYGLGVHEALCCGLPALVTRSAGVAERYPPTLAGLLLSNPDDVEELVRALWAWREDEGTLRREVLALSERLRAHTWDHMAAQLVRLVEHG
jgi:glycosyltransferase involved in cell wall biosynthesis